MLYTFPLRGNIQGISLNRKTNNTKQLQEVPEIDRGHRAPPCQSKQQKQRITLADQKS